MIEVTDFHKNYGETVAVAGLTFAVQPGEVLGLVGPNGAGKTSTLRAISGVIPATHGELKIAGHDVAAKPVQAKLNLAYVPDDPRLFESLTVWEHLQFIAKAYRLEHWEERGENLLARFELSDKRHTLAQELSRGMRQKTAVCAALLHEPKALLFDEPLTGLDPRGIRTIKESILDAAANGAAVVVSSHLLELVEGLCSHLLILRRGEALFVGTIEEARRRYAEPGGEVTLEDVFFRMMESGEEGPVEARAESEEAS